MASVQFGRTFHIRSCQFAEHHPLFHAFFACLSFFAYFSDHACVFVFTVEQRIVFLTVQSRLPHAWNRYQTRLLDGRLHTAVVDCCQLGLQRDVDFMQLDCPALSAV